MIDSYRDQWLKPSSKLLLDFPFCTHQVKLIMSQALSLFMTFPWLNPVGLQFGWAQ